MSSFLRNLIIPAIALFSATLSLSAEAQRTYADAFMLNTLERLELKIMNQQIDEAISHDPTLSARRTRRTAPSSSKPEAYVERRNLEHLEQGRTGERVLNAHGGLAKYGIEVVESAQALRAAWNPLSNADREFDPNFENSGPTVPSRCAESTDCLTCYERAVHKIDFNRFYIERARAITVSTIRLADAAKSFGDNVSGIHAVTGLAWQTQGKPQIVESVDELRGTYRRKAGEYLENLEQAMQELGQCEEKHYDERDWYQRFGFLYVEFMRDRYLRAAD